LAQPQGTLQGQIRITEQGEIIASKYSDPQIAGRNLEALLSASLESTLQASLAAGAGNAFTHYEQIMQELSANAFEAYQDLVYRTPGFDLFFRQITPMTELAGLNIGSRPASRSSSIRIEDLRAIPWVFSWSQARIMLPGWYGFATAVEKWLSDHEQDLRPLQDMAREWPFFKTALQNMAMVLAKTNSAIAERYAQLADAELYERIWPRLRSELQRTVRLVQDISGQELLADNPTLKRSIEHRFPYIDPLNHLQVELLKRVRRGEVDGLSKRAIHLSINGISSGLRNSG
jgi:phosphoenolpyruvate carboxylase